MFMTTKPACTAVAILVPAGMVIGQHSSDLALALADQMRADTLALTNAIGASAADSAPKVSGQIQVRYLINQRDKVVGGEDTATGFQMRRAKIAFKGTVGDEWGYKINGAFSRSSGSFTLEDAYITHSMDESWTIKVGQFKLPFMREESVSSSRQLAADRSITNEFFNQDRSQGVEASNSSEQFRYSVAITDGMRAGNSDFTATSEADYGFTGRVEYLFSGSDWGRFKDFTSWKDSDYTGMLGGAVHWQTGGDTFGTVDQDLIGATADVSVEGNGWNGYFAGNYQEISPAIGADLENYGFVAQGGYFVNPTWELFGRYDMLFSEQNDDFSTVTIGANKYFTPDSHAAKLTVDLQFFLDEQSLSDAPASTGTGLLASGEDGQFALRAQFQILF